jgi:hypothetical protein
MQAPFHFVDQGAERREPKKQNGPDHPSRSSVPSIFRSSADTNVNLDPWDSPLSKAALIQALRFELKLRPRDLARLVGCTPQYATQIAPRAPYVSDASVTPWEDRQDEQREAAIEEARKLILGNRSTAQPLLIPSDRN